MASFLDIRTAVPTTERAMVDAISLALAARHPAVADLPSLKAVPSMPIAGSGDRTPPGILRYVNTEGVVYRWRKFSRNDEALPFVLLPSDRAPSSMGRWERQQSTVTYGPNYLAPVHRVQTGYAKAVQLWEGNEGDEAARNAIYGQSPAFLIRWDADTLRMMANHPRGLNEVDMTMEVWCFSRNLRGEQEALEGSPVASEALADPGLWRMMGDIRYILAGSDLGLAPGVRYVDIQGSGSIIEEDLNQRRFCGMVPITIKASLDIPDEDLVACSEIGVQFQTAQPTVNDVLNHVAQGYGFPVTPNMGLTAEPAPGVAYIAGQVVSSTPPPHLFTASMDTYRDLGKDGLLIYSTAPSGTPAENVYQTPNTLRLGVTRTNATDIIGDAFLCDVAVNYGEQFVVKTG